MERLVNIYKQKDLKICEVSMNSVRQFSGNIALYMAGKRLCFI